MTAYYNEIDEKAAAWLRELIRRGLIAPGDVDTRSIEDVSPDDLRPYTQCHFFAGIGVWSYALRLAGWPDDRPAWTGSCPCQPFSAAGKGGGFADERHLWPAQFHLIRERRPVVWFGEQVASKDGLAWLDLVSSDLENAGYAVGAVDTCSAGFGAPHIRQRLRIAAQRLDDATGARHVRPIRNAEGLARDETRLRLSGVGSEVERMADAEHAIGRAQRIGGKDGCNGQDGRRAEAHSIFGTCGEICRLADANDARSQGRIVGRDGTGERASWARGLELQGQPGPVNGFWRDADWIFCRDGKWRAVEPGSFPLVDGASARMVRLRGYGNAVDAIATKEFIEAYLAIEGSWRDGIVSKREAPHRMQQMTLFEAAP